MAKIVIGLDYGSYTFNKVAKTVTINLPSGNVKLEGLLLITDTTNNTIIYQFSDATKGATLSGNVFTLTYDTNTASFANTDRLQIFYYDEQFISQQMNDMSVALSQILKSLQRPNYLENNLYSRSKSYGGYLDTVTTVGSVNILLGIGTTTRFLEDQINPPRSTTWQLAVRNRIS
jgi:hypothetical protein